MSDSIFSGVLVFSLLSAGTIAIGSEWVGSRQAPTAAAASAPAVRVVVLPRVEITGKRPAAMQLAVETRAVQPTRAQ